MRVKLKYPNVDTFLQKYGPNISKGGVFIVTKTPKPVGTPIRFDFLLMHDGVEESVLRGEGTVEFVKEHDPDAPGRAHGMGVHFTRLFGDGEALVERALRMRSGAPEPPPTPGLPNGVRELTGEFELITGPVPRMEPEAEPAATPPRIEPTAPLEVGEPEPRHVEPSTVEAAPGSDALDALAAEVGITPERVQAVLRRRWNDRTDADELLKRAAPSPTSIAEARAQLDVLLTPRRRKDD
jgi:molecular chaperone DnaK